MALTAREWLLLPNEEQKRRQEELSSEECFKLRTLYSEIHLSEEDKRNMPRREREEFLLPRQKHTEGEDDFYSTAQALFKRLSEEAKR